MVWGSHASSAADAYLKVNIGMIGDVIMEITRERPAYPKRESLDNLLSFDRSNGSSLQWSFFELIILLKSALISCCTGLVFHFADGMVLIHPCLMLRITRQCELNFNLSV